jgi:CheY-like chemotaxis protein
MLILLVEDNEFNRDMLSRRLTRAGYEVVCAEDGPQGVRMADEARPDLVLMDVALGAMDGWEATQLIHANEALRTTPVIAITAHALEIDRSRSVEVGCCDFDTKPIDFARLIGKIERQLSPVRAGAPNTRPIHERV